MLNFKALASDIFVHIINLESPLLRSVFKLFQSPSFVVYNYIRGHRGYYFSPSKMLFYAMLAAGLYLGFADGPKRLFGLHFDIEGMAPQLAFVLTLIPFVSFFSWLAYFKEERKYLHHLIAAIYTISVTTLVFVTIELALVALGLLSVQSESLILLGFLLTIYTFTACIWKRKWLWRIVFLLFHLILSGTGLFLFVKATAIFFPNQVHF